MDTRVSAKSKLINCVVNPTSAEVGFFCVIVIAELNQKLTWKTTGVLSLTCYNYLAD